jgi:centromere/kinetochore protein ZW10
LDLRVIFKSLSAGSLSNHISTLRRDFQSYFIDHVLKQPYALNIDTSNPNEIKLTLIPAPPNNEDLRSRLDNISHILDFLSFHLIPYLPETEGNQFARSLSRPIASSVLNNLLMPSLPSSFGLLPSFLSLLERAVLLEENHISKLLGMLGNEGIIKSWSDVVSGHYERRRRIEILELARKAIVEAGDPNDTFKVIISDGGLETSRSAIPKSQDEDFKDDAWGFDEPTTSNPLSGFTDGWGFDDDTNATTPVEEEREVELEPEEAPMDIDEKQNINDDGDVDPADAWGWNEEEDVPDESPQTAETLVPEVVAPEDDVWDDPWSDSGEQSEPEPPIISPSFTSPKVATRLEKSVSKNKKHLNGNSSITNSPLASPSNHEIPHRVIVPPPALSLHPPPEDISRPGHVNGAHLPIIAPKEHYQVPTRTKRYMRMVETVIDESKLFYASNLFPASKDMVPAPGSILSQSASSILDLYQALYPVKFAKDLELPEQAMLFSNSCLYMANSVQQIEDTLYGQPVLKDRLSECRHHLQLLGESWFNETIVRIYILYMCMLHD